MHFSEEDALLDELESLTGGLKKKSSAIHAEVQSQHRLISGIKEGSTQASESLNQSADAARGLSESTRMTSNCKLYFIICLEILLLVVLLYFGL